MRIIVFRNEQNFHFRMVNMLPKSGFKISLGSDFFLIQFITAGI